MPVDLSSLNTAFAAPQRRSTPEPSRYEPSQRAAEARQEARQSEPQRGARSQPASERTANERSARAAREDAPPSRSKSDNVQRNGQTQPADFRRSLEEKAPAPAVPMVEPETSEPLVPAMEGENPLLAVPVDGEIAVSLVLPAALGEQAIQQVAVDVAGLNQALTTEQSALMVSAPEVDGLALPATGVVDQGEDGEGMVALAGALAAQQATGDDQQMAIVVRVGGEEVPVTLQVLPKPEVAALPSMAQGTAPQPMLATAGQVPADPQAGLAQVLSAAPVVPGLPTDQGPQLSTQILQQQAAGVSSVPTGIATQLVQAPAPVSDAAAVALPADGDGPSASLVSTLSPSATANVSTEGLRATATPEAAPSPGQPTKGEAVERAVQQQITRAVVQQMANGDRTLTLRLTPPQLGTVRIELVESRGQITVRFHAEDDNVRHALERQLPQLRQDLRAADAPVASLRMEDGPNGWHQGQHQHQNGQGAEQSADRRGQGPAFSLDGGFASEENANGDQPATASLLGGQVSDSAVDARA